jgi:PAS domain S-box-containing protein
MEWQLTFDAIESPLLLMDLDGRIRRMNQAAQELSGRSYQQNVGQYVGSISSREPWQKAAQIVAGIRNERDAVSQQVKDEASGKTWDIAASLFLPPGAEHEWVIVAARDITRMVELQESLRRGETMSAMGSLLAGVAHEVRNPLFGISATLDAFEARFGSGEEYQQYTRVLKGEVDRLTRLMQELLDYGRPPSLNLANGQVSRPISEAIQMCKPIAERSRIRIINRVAGPMAPLAMDERRLVQVFHNLLENSVQHSSAGCEVVVEAEEVMLADGRWIDCKILDRGTGFRIEDLPLVFEPFFTRRRGGTGLGLSIVKRIVEEHGGEVKAGNRAEGGAVVVVRLPAMEA